jgi:catechol 2,3-dioxygenase
VTVRKPTLHHVTIKTSRLAEMVAWYRTVVGAEVQVQNEHAAWMTNDDANHRVAFLAVPGLADDPHKSQHNGMHNRAFEYGSFADLVSSYERLKEHNILSAFSVDRGLTTSMYYRDPEGNYVELQCDNFGDGKKSGHWMRTARDFAANPTGTFFDPEKVLQAFRSGQPFETLQAAMWAGKFAPDTIPNVGLPQSG